MQRPPDTRKSPVVAYAIILGVLVVGAIVFSTQFGRTHENPKPSAVSSPAAETPHP